MSLIAFHKFLITTAVLFCLGFALRQLSQFQATGHSGTLLTAIAFGVAALALGFYLNHLRAILKIPSARADLGAPKPLPDNLGDDLMRPRRVSSLTKRRLSVSQKNGDGRQESKTEEE